MLEKTLHRFHSRAYVAGFLFASLAFGFSTQLAHAQFGLQVGQMRESAWSQRFQPANIAEGEFEHFRYSGQATGWFGNTDARIAGVFGENGYITNATKERLLEDIEGEEQITAGYNLNLANVNVKIKGHPFAFSLDQDLSVSAHMANENTLGILLRGNRPYAGLTVSDDDLWATYTHTRTLGIASAWKFDKLSFGARLNLIQGLNYTHLEQASYSLYTAPDGAQVTLNADYDLYGSEGRGFFKFNGFGAGADLGVAYEVNEKLRLDAAVIGAGFTQWKGIHVADQVSIDWEGISINSLIEDSLPEVLEQQADSLRGLIFPDTVDGNKLLLLPFQVRIGGTYQISDNGTLGLQLVYVPMRTGPITPLPVVNVSYRHNIIQGLVLGANAYFGGGDAFGVGAVGAYAIPVGSVHINLLAGSDNLLGFVASNFGRGFSAYGGIGVDF